MANEVRLIDANEADPRSLAYPVFPGCQPYNQYERGFNDAVIACYGLLMKAPTVDAVEVVHARWNDDGRCTKCGRYMPFDCEGNAYESIYCPDCGAVMTGR